MSAGNDFWATRAGAEFLAAVKNIAKSSGERNDILKAQNKLIEAQNTLLNEQNDIMREISEQMKYLR